MSPSEKPMEKEKGGKIPVALGIGATAARHALDVEIGVRIPDPQQNRQAVIACE
jgi:hypothetical protein